MESVKAQLADLQASLAEKDERIMELLERPTIEEIQDARTGALVFRADEENNAVRLEFEIQESENLKDWTSRPDNVTATLPLAEGKKFIRIALTKG